MAKEIKRGREEVKDGDTSKKPVTLTSLPEETFAGLVNLQNLYLYSNVLTRGDFCRIGKFTDPVLIFERTNHLTREDFCRIGKFTDPVLIFERTYQRGLLPDW